MIAYEVEVSDRVAARKLIPEMVPNDPPGLIVSAPAAVVDRQTGEALALLGRYPESEMADLRWAMRNYSMGSVPRAAGIRNRSETFGYSARNEVMKRPECRVSAGSIATPRAHAFLMEAGEVLAEVVKDLDPARYASDLAQASKAILPDWRIGNTPWTSGILNETSSLQYHTDRNNLTTWSAMVVCRRQVSGGMLHIPELDVLLTCRDGDVVWFPGWRFVHGVTPMTKLDVTGYRYSAVFYTVAKMGECQEPAAELARGRRVRSEREDTLIERQRESGWLTS